MAKPALFPRCIQTLVPIVGAAVLLSGCVITTTGDGELEVSWSIASTTKSSLCSAHGADEIQISLYDEDGVLVERDTEDCESFSTRIDDLEPGDYTVSAVLLDEDGDEITSELGPKDVEIDDDGTSSVSFNFSSSTFVYTKGSGKLTVTWEVAESDTDSACNAWGAETLVLRLYDADGDQWGDEFDEDCTDFSLSVTSVPEGTYTAQARLEDEDGSALTSWKLIEDITIVDDETSYESVEFEASGFDGELIEGELEIEWTIAEESDDLWCELYGAEAIELSLYDDESSLYVDPVQVPCEAFSTRISELPVGDYTIGAVLVDEDGDAVSTAVPPVAVTVFADNVTLEWFDFPEDSFY